MFGYLFNQGECRLFELYAPGQEDPDEFRHTFGGEAHHEGVIPPEGKKPVHLFYQFDLADPRVGWGFPSLGLSRFPLYYALEGQGGPFHYHVVSDSRIEILSQPYPAEYRAKAMRRQPRPFRFEVIDLGEHRYDPTQPQDVYNYGGIFGIGMLTAEQKAELRVNMDLWFQKTLPHRSLLEDYDMSEGGEEPPMEELVSSFSPFTQGIPEAGCPNEACEWYRTENELPVMAYLEPEDKDPFYKRIAGADNGQLIWSVCPKCASVSVINPCT